MLPIFILPLKGKGMFNRHISPSLLINFVIFRNLGHVVGILKESYRRIGRHEKWVCVVPMHRILSHPRVPTQLKKTPSTKKEENKNIFPLPKGEMEIYVNNLDPEFYQGINLLQNGTENAFLFITIALNCAGRNRLQIIYECYFLFKKKKSNKKTCHQN